MAKALLIQPVKTNNRERNDDIGEIPFPKRDLKYLSNTNQYQVYYPSTSQQISVAQVLYSRGCPFGEEYHKKYLPKDYDFSEFIVEIPVINHPTLTRQQLIDLRLELVQNFYLDTAYQERISGKIKKYPHLLDSYFEYFKFLEDKGIFDDSRLTNVLKEVL